MSEAELLRAFVERRSEGAFAALVQRYAGLVFSTAHRRLGNATLAEDITQLVFIRLAQKPPALRTGAELAAWLHRTTVHVTIDLWRSETRRQARELEATLMETAPSDTVVWEEIAPKLDEALNELRDDDRQVLALRFFSGKSMREVGSLLGVSEDAAKMRVNRAVERLRMRMGVGGAACPAAALAVLLGERAVEAVPARLLARLEALKLSATGAVGAAGVLAMLLQGAKWKWAAAFAGVFLAGTGLFMVAHSRAETKSARGLAANSTAKETAQTTGRVEFDRLARMSDAARSNGSPSPEPGVKMLFRVVDAQTGQPLENTRVSVGAFGPGGQGESHHLLTDLAGVARIPEPDDPAKNTMNVFVVAEGHVPMAVGFRSPITPADYTVKLDPATTLSGTVVDENGQPVGGVRIEVRSPGARIALRQTGFGGLLRVPGMRAGPAPASLPGVDGPNENIDFQMSPVTNHDDGTWTFGYLPVDLTNEFTVMLKKEGYMPALPRLAIATMGRSNLALVIHRGYAVAGQVVDTNRMPVANSQVRILTGDRAQEQSARTDRDGRFQMTGIAGDPMPDAIYVNPPPATNAEGKWIIQEPLIKGPRHVELSIQARSFASQRLTVDLVAVTNRADVVLAAGKIIRGRVVDENGAPISNAVAQTDWDNHEIHAFEWSSRTDADGRFEWDAMADVPVLFWFDAEGYQPQRRVELSADGRDHEIRLERQTMPN